MNCPGHFAVALLFLLPSLAHAQPQPKADADFPFQGEYVGEADARGQKFGIQVIALGERNFRAVVYPGGLPGDGWTKDKPKVKVDGTRSDDTVTFAGGRVGGTIKNNIFTLTNFNGKEMGALKRVE